jgi:CO dehydrogenase maturation factor
LGIIKLRDDGFLREDTDAGIEHLVRGVDKGCGVILAVIDPSQESIKLANKIAKMAEENQDFPKVIFIVEKRGVEDE